MPVDNLWISHIWDYIFPKLLSLSVDNSKWLPTTNHKLECFFVKTTIKYIHSYYRLFSSEDIFIKDYLHRVKFEGEFDSIGEITNYIKQAITELEKQHYYSYDYILFVPADKKRKLVRGYHLIELVAYKLKDLRVIPVLTKLKTTTLQSKKNRVRRIQDMEGVYRLVTQKEFNLTNKKILLLDDIVTTASTVNQCGKVIKNLFPSVLIDVLCITGGKPV
jgi:competence protein ComFC